MISAHYEVGLSGRGACISTARTEDLFTLGESLPPGSYWIRKQVHPTRTGQRFDPQDWGTIEVSSNGWWKLRGPGGLQVGPGYAVV